MTTEGVGGLSGQVNAETHNPKEEGAMETAKVDIRKLQLLNDRIVQTIDALNQVRLSVHGLGLSHTAGFPLGTTTFPVAQTLSPIPTAYNPYAYQAQTIQPMLPQYQTLPYTTGLAHSTPYFGQLPFIPYATPFAPFGYQTQTTPLFGYGLSHTTAETFDPTRFSAYQTGTIDPLLASRLNQSFPFVWAPFTPYA
ncbi:MAG: hypothetical protein RMK29_20120 [Myxococcales bacterium]|nr:hypothetical protein [Myxococcota bacterium]MDW8284017.1 hypothetical protein [Myxococcales bacterium]